MILQDIRKYNAVYHKDCSLNWLETGVKVGNHIRKKKTYPSISMSKVIVPDGLEINTDVLNESRRLYAITGEMIPIYLSYDFKLIAGYEQYVLAQELGMKKIPAQRITQQKMNRKERKAFINAVHNVQVGNKKFPVTANDGSVIYVSLCRARKVRELEKLANRLNYRYDILPDFTFSIYDDDMNYIIGSTNHGAILSNATKRLTALYNRKQSQKINEEESR